MTDYNLTNEISKGLGDAFC